MVVLVSGPSGSIGEIITVELQRIVCRSDLEGSGVVSAYVFGLSERSRVDKTDISTLVKEVPAGAVELINRE
jgi:hypothetical protein